jgi:hypothetical protein
MVEVGVAMAEVYLLFARSFFPNFMMSCRRGNGDGALSAGIPGMKRKKMRANSRKEAGS